MDVQDVKDTFYRLMRDRIAAGNAGRTVLVRGVLRPAVIVMENELPASAVDGIAPADCFCLHWTSLRSAAGLMELGCEIRYATDGSAGAAGLDRGRALGAMDTELLAAVDTAPQNVAGFALSESAAGGTTQNATGTQVFWSDLVFGPAALRGERIERTATCGGVRL